MRLVAAVILAILLNACSGKHVTFFHPNTVAEAQDEARLFLDARGDLYPQTGIAATYALPSDANGSLFEAARGADPALCLRAADGTEMAELCSVVVNDCSGTSTEGCFNRWVEVQERLWQRRGRVISSRFSGNGNATLGVLIHGFNNWYRESEASYSVGQKQMRRFANPAQSLFGDVQRRSQLSNAKSAFFYVIENSLCGSVQKAVFAGQATIFVRTINQ